MFALDDRMGSQVYIDSVHPTLTALKFPYTPKERLGGIPVLRVEGAGADEWWTKRFLYKHS